MRLSGGWNPLQHVLRCGSEVFWAGVGISPQSLSLASHLSCSKVLPQTGCKLPSCSGAVFLYECAVPPSAAQKLI